MTLQPEILYSELIIHAMEIRHQPTALRQVIHEVTHGVESFMLIVNLRLGGTAMVHPCIYLDHTVR